MATILLVEDSVDLAIVIARELSNVGYTVEHVVDSPSAIEAHARLIPDLLILDWMLPKLDGLDVLRNIRQHASTPVLMLTARGEEMDRVVGLEVGADDYLTKPFSMRELIARVHALLRRAEVFQKMLAADHAADQHIALILLLALWGLVLLAIVPFIMLFSYLFMRPIARRIQQLVDATSAMRGGNYHIRIPVTGDNEIAQLQTDFNSMAGDLERHVQELRDERDTVATLLENRRQLIASVGHELRTPVATLRGYLESLRSHHAELAPETLDHDIEVMERETIRLQRLIDDLFALSQAEVSSLTLNCQPNDIGTILQGVGETVAPLAWKHSRVEVVVLPCTGLPPVLADMHRLTQVVLNLVHNAIRYTPPGGLVVINAMRMNAAVAIRVRDTGEGIASDDVPHVWERFYRGQEAGKSSTEGAGLGLAIVKELTEAMGGSVAVESIRGIGSCFTISLPLASQS